MSFRRHRASPSEQTRRASVVRTLAFIVIYGSLVTSVAACTIVTVENELVCYGKAACPVTLDELERARETQSLASAVYVGASAWSIVALAVGLILRRGAVLLRPNRRRAKIS